MKTRVTIVCWRVVVPWLPLIRRQLCRGSQETQLNPCVSPIAHHAAKIFDGFKGVVHSAVLCSYPRPRLPPPGCLGSSSWCRASASWRPRCPQRSWPAATLTCHAVWRERHTVTPRIQPPPPSLSNNQAHICKYDNINIYIHTFWGMAWHIF